MQAQAAPSDAGYALKARPIFTVGTIRYTRAGLVELFFWLLWGDLFCSLMTVVVPTLLPLILHRYRVPAIQIAAVVSGIPTLSNVVLNPIISYNFDRTRTRFGRRRPYIMLTTPGAVVFLAAIPFAP